MLYIVRTWSWGFSLAHPHSKKTSVAGEQKRRNICNFSRTDVICFLKESDLRKEKWGSPSIQQSKVAAKFSKRPSIRTVTSLHDISQKTWIHSYPINGDAFLEYLESSEWGHLLFCSPMDGKKMPALSTIHGSPHFPPVYKMASGCTTDDIDVNSKKKPLNEGTTVYYKCRAALPRSFTKVYMEEVYKDVCTVKHAASLTSQQILECVSNIALGWLRLAFKKIHSKDISSEACHVEEAHVMKMVNVLKENHSQFPSNLDSPAKPHDSVSVVKKTVKKKAVKGDMQPTSEDRQGHNVRCSKRLLEKESTGQPPEKKSKMVDGDDDDIVVIEDTDDHDDEDEEEEEEEEKEEEEDMVMSWKEFYKRPSNQDTPTRTAYLSEYYKFVQTIHGGWVREDEALEHTRQVHRLMTTIDGDSDSIDCLLDRERVWDWVLPRIETQLSGRQLQKYLLSLEKFYRFIKWHSNFPPHLKVSKKTKKLATNLEQLCPNWRRSIHKIAEEKRWKCLLANPVYIQQRVSEAARRARLIRSVFKRASASTATSSEQNHAQEPTTAWPRRKKWDRRDTNLLKKHFKKNPGRKAIRKKMKEVGELQKLIKREGSERCFEKVKSLFKTKK